MAEIGQGGGPHALEVAAVGREGEVGRQHLRLGQARLQLDGADHLDELGAEGAGPGLQQPGGLHAEGRGARDDAAVQGRRPQRPQHGETVHARVLQEPGVLQGHQPPEEAGIGAGEIRPDPPAPLLHRQGPEPGAVAVQRHRRGVHELGEVGREDRVEGDGGGFEGEEGDQGADEDPQASLPSGGRDRGRGSKDRLGHHPSGRLAGKFNAADPEKAQRTQRRREAVTPMTSLRCVLCAFVASVASLFLAGGFAARRGDAGAAPRPRPLPLKGEGRLARTPAHS